MDHYRETGQVDPDYESYNSALELNEEEEQKENYNKLKKILEEEYNREIALRRDQVEKIELQICKTRKLLHLVRYALIMSYYKKKELEYNGTEEEIPSDSLIVPDKQNRIHPAIKKLLGTNVNNLDHINITDKRKSSSRHLVSRKVGESLSSSSESKKIKLDVSVPQTVEKTSIELPNADSKTSPEFSRSRKKSKYRIVVGNISKWMPSAEDVLLTHKWMVYVRGPKEKPDVSHFVDKVVYHLHPSYKPHDVVEVSESPFHLSRRGWGEFPVRVQIFFKETLNKPIDVVHNIKLDKTYSGRQTLGNETIVDVFLYNQKSAATSSQEDEINQQVNENSEEIDVQNIKLEEELLSEECNLSEMDNANVEHDYCSGNVQEEALEDNSKTHNFEHSYSLPSSHEGLPKPKKEKIEQDESNKLIYGLDLYCGENEEQERATNKTIIPANYIKQLIQLNRKDIKFNNTKIIVLGKKVEGSFLASFGKLTSRGIVSPNRVEANSIKVTLPKNRFKSMGEVLPYLFKRLPLHSELANNANYKRMYPFTASSLKEFASWNVGKKRSSEWSRARAIKKILVAEKFPGIENWTTKALLMYGRSHEYTPFVSNALFVRDSEEKKLLMNSYSNSCHIVKSQFHNNMKDEQDVTVNVDSDTTSPKKTKPLIDISDPTTTLERSFIRQNALDVGVILKSEEIIEGVKVNGAEMVILEAVKCLADNLIRKAKNYRVCTKPLSSNTSAISLEDVEAALNERSEFFHIQQFQIEKNEFFS